MSLTSVIRLMFPLLSLRFDSVKPKVNKIAAIALQPNGQTNKVYLRVASLLIVNLSKNSYIKDFKISFEKKIVKIDHVWSVWSIWNLKGNKNNIFQVANMFSEVVKKGLFKVWIGWCNLGLALASRCFAPWRFECGEGGGCSCFIKCGGGILH